MLFGRQLGPEGELLGLDVDKNGIQRAQSILTDLMCKVTLVCENFARIDEVLAQQGIEKVDFIFADLGFWTHNWDTSIPVARNLRSS